MAAARPDPDPPAAPGVRAAKQARSREKHQALRRAGRRLLATQSLETLSVARIAREAGIAVGSFYTRYADKEAWFAEVLQLVGDEVLADVQALLDSARWRRAPVARQVEWIVRRLVELHRQHRGLMRTVLGDAARASRYGVPLQEVGQRLADAVDAALADRLPPMPPAQRRLRVGIALQLVYGVLVNAVLRDPGPLKLDDPRLPGELAAAFVAAARIDG